MMDNAVSDAWSQVRYVEIIVHSGQVIKAAKSEIG